MHSEVFFKTVIELLKYKSEKLLSSKQSQEKIFDDISHELGFCGISYMAKFTSVDELQKKLNDSLNRIIDRKSSQKN